MKGKLGRKEFALVLRMTIDFSARSLLQFSLFLPILLCDSFQKRWLFIHMLTYHTSYLFFGCGGQYTDHETHVLFHLLSTPMTVRRRRHSRRSDPHRRSASHGR